MNVGDQVDITTLTGVCVFCETVIFTKGLCAGGVRQEVMDHLKTCPKSPYRGIRLIKYSDDPRLEGFNGTPNKD